MMTTPQGTRLPTPVPAIIALAAALAAGTTGAAERSAAPWNFQLHAEVEARYDDNIIGLSEGDKAFLDSSPTTGEDRFGVESADDTVLAPQVALAFLRQPRRGPETGITLTVRGNRYIRNSVKNYEEVRARLGQELSKSRAHRTSLTVGAGLIPEYFLRRLIDEDESDPGLGIVVRHDADYRLTRGNLAISQEIVNRVLSAEVGYAREKRDYNRHFDERDSTSDVLSLDVRVYPLRRTSLLVRPFYEHESRDTRGDLASSSTVVDDDVGFDSDLLGLAMRWLWGPDRDHRHTASFFYQNEVRDFATETATDTGHFGREDDIAKVGLGYEAELGPIWKLAVAATHRENDVSFPGQPTTTFKKNVVAVSLGYRFDRPIGSRPEVTAPDR